MAGGGIVPLLSLFCGWAYFAAWSASFYPQLLLNQRLRSVRGLSFDFVVLNITGFCAYALYTALLYALPAARAAFAADRGVPPQVPVNDVVFGAHGAAICAAIAVQCALFPRGSQRVRAPVAVFCAAAWAVLLCGGAAAAAGKVPWLTYLDACGGIKVVCSFFKYVPQVLFNWQRQSTAGFAATGLALDLTGGLFSLLQQALTASVLRSWVPFTRNVAKTFLALETLAFDAILLYQHFVLYAGTGRSGADADDGCGKKSDDGEDVPMLRSELWSDSAALNGVEMDSRSRSAHNLDGGLS